MENRNGIVIDLSVGSAAGSAEHGLAMLQELGGAHRITVAGDKGYDSAGFVASCRRELVEKASTCLNPSSRTD